MRGPPGVQVPDFQGRSLACDYQSGSLGAKAKAAAVLGEEARAGKLGGEAVDAVLESVGEQLRLPAAVGMQLGIAVTVTDVPGTIDAEQPVPQSMPAGLDVTGPPPLPAFVTVSPY